MSSLRIELQERITRGELARLARGESVPWPANFLDYLQKVADAGISLAIQREIAGKITLAIMVELLELYDDPRRCGGIPSVLHSMSPKKVEPKDE